MKKIERGMMIATVMAVALLSGCAGTTAAYKAADGLEETAFVFSNHFRLLVAEGNDLADEGVLSGSALSRMQDIVRAAQPLLAETSRTARAYKAVKSAETQQDLTEAIAAAAVQVSNLYNAIQRAGGSTSLLEHIDRERELLLVANLNWSTP